VKNTLYKWGNYNQMGQLWHFMDHGHVHVEQIYFKTSAEERTTYPWESREKMDTSSCYPLHVSIYLTLLELFSQMWVKENDKMIPQNVPLEYKRFVIRGWRPPTWDFSQEGTGMEQTKPPMKKWRCVMPSKTPSTDTQRLYTRMTVWTNIIHRKQTLGWY